MIEKKEVTYEKCQICGFEAKTIVFDENEGACPDCGSTDVDDIDANPYEDEDDEEW